MNITVSEDQAECRVIIALLEARDTVKPKPGCTSVVALAPLGDRVWLVIEYDTTTDRYRIHGLEDASQKEAVDYQAKIGNTGGFKQVGSARMAFTGDPTQPINN